VIAHSSRRKSFIFETRCFNNVHILSYIKWGVKSRDGLVAIRLDISKGSDLHVLLANKGVTHSVKLPPIKLEPSAGDVETWARFWEQFESSIDKDPTLSVVNKHVFLRGYL
jgi:hypothetical protein